MTLDVQKYVRKPFTVDAVQVTEQNMYQVAKWCHGRVKTDNKAWGERKGQKYIKVEVPNAINDRQMMAYVGDWVLASGAGKGPKSFKVYTPKAFDNSFQKEAERMIEVVSRMEERAADEDVEKQEEQLFSDISPSEAAR